MADRVSSQCKRKTMQFRGIFVWIVIFGFMHFITKAFYRRTRPIQGKVSPLRSSIKLGPVYTQYGKDRIEYDVTENGVQISALQPGVCARVQGCVRACAVEIKPGMLRAALVYVFRRAYGLPYKMATFIAKKGLFNTVYSPGAY